MRVCGFIEHELVPILLDRVSAMCVKIFELDVETVMCVALALTVIIVRVFNKNFHFILIKCNLTYLITCFINLAIT
jgi:hypothetical protein